MFSGDVTASSSAKILKLNRKTVNSYYNEFRRLILEHSLRERDNDFVAFFAKLFFAKKVKSKKYTGLGPYFYFGNDNNDKLSISFFEFL